MKICVLLITGSVITAIKYLFNQLILSYTIHGPLHLFYQEQKVYNEHQSKYVACSLQPAALHPIDQKQSFRHSFWNLVYLVELIS